MLELLNITMLIGTENFGIGKADNGNPALFIFGFPIYVYALIIVAGMCVAMLVAGALFKKRGYDPYDITIYAIFIIPLAVLGCRLYVYIFPWDGRMQDWSTFFNFRSGGLGIYGGVIFGYITAYIVSKVRKQDFRIIADCIIPGLLIAQSIGRWGNFVNQEAYGNLVANPNLQFFPFAVFIDAKQGWYQATFFYESLATFIGFIICLILIRNNKYKLGWMTAFYGIYYGIVRILVEGLRSDSLFLWIGNIQTDIKISQLVSVFTILIGLWTLSNIYRKQLHGLYRKLFRSEYDELSKSRFVLVAVSALSLGLAIALFAIGGATNFIAGFFLSLLAAYCFIGIFAVNDRMKLYCANCFVRNEPEGGVVSQSEKDKMSFIALIVAAFVTFVLGVYCFVAGFLDGLANNFVLGVIFLLICGLSVYKATACSKTVKIDIKGELRANGGAAECVCGKSYAPKLNKFLLFVFPYKVYKDYGVEHLKPYVEVKKDKSSSNGGEQSGVEDNN